MDKVRTFSAEGPDFFYGAITGSPKTLIRRRTKMRNFILVGVVLAAASLCLPVEKTEAGDDWQWWLYTPVSFKPTEEIKADVTGMFRWKNDMKDYFYRGVISGAYYSVTSWMDLGAHYWYKETRTSTDTPWVYTNVYVGRINFKYKPAHWIALKEYNRIEYNNHIYRWTFRIKPRVEFPLGWMGLKPVKLYLDNELYFNFDFQDNRDTYSENRFTVAVDVKIAGPVGATVAYRNVGKKSSATDSWNFTNVLVTYAKLAF